MKKKILFVVNTMGNAGVEHALIELLKALDPGRYRLYLYVLLDQGELIGQIPKGVRILNTRYSRLSVWGRRGRARLARTLLARSLRRLALLRRLGYLLSVLGEMAGTGRLLLDKLLWRLAADGAERFPVTFDLAVAFVEGGSTYYVADYVNAKRKAAFVHVDYGLAGYSRRLDGGCYRQYDRIFAVSDEVEQAFVRIYPEYAAKLSVFPNLLDVADIQRKAGCAGGFSDAYDGFRILTVGRLTAQKAYEVAVDAMALVRDRGYRARWYVLGEGECRRGLEKRIARLGLKEDFVLLGAVSNPYPYYAAADLYVHATRYEGKSIAVQEAQILGCAILASDCSGNRGQLTSGVDGLLCGLTAEAVAEGIIYLIEHPDVRRRFEEASAQRVTADSGGIEPLTALMA